MKILKNKVFQNVLKLSGLREGIFLERINRFLGLAKYKDQIIRIHIHDSGRIPLLKSGSKILFEPKATEKTQGKLISFYDQNYGWVFANSGYHSKIMEKLLPIVFPDLVDYKKEVKIDNHRIDFLVNTKKGSFLLEVKGCTWFRQNVALFPDAPTQRGINHLKILSKYKGSYLVFLVMNDKPKYLEIADPNFEKELEKGLKNDLNVVGSKFRFGSDGVLKFMGYLKVFKNYENK